MQARNSDSNSFQACIKSSCVHAVVTRETRLEIDIQMKTNCEKKKILNGNFIGLYVVRFYFIICRATKLTLLLSICQFQNRRLQALPKTI